MSGLVCVEFYGRGDFQELLGAVDAPADMAKSWAIQMGRLICKMRGRDSVNAAFVNVNGDTYEKMIILR